MTAEQMTHCLRVIQQELAGDLAEGFGEAHDEAASALYDVIERFLFVTGGGYGGDGGEAEN